MQASAKQLKYILWMFLPVQRTIYENSGSQRQLLLQWDSQIVWMWKNCSQQLKKSGSKNVHMPSKWETKEQEPPIQRKRRCIDVGEVDREKNFQEKFIGLREVSLENLKSPDDKFLCRKIKPEWVSVLRDRLNSTTMLQTVLPVLVDPGEVECKDDFCEENLQSYSYLTLGGNHLREALNGIPSLPENLRSIQCHIYAGLTPEEAIIIGNHNSKNKHLTLTFQDKVRQARQLYMQDKNNLRERLSERLGLLEMKDINRDSLSTIISVAKYCDDAYKAASHCFDISEAKFGVNKSFPQKIFRLLQGERDETIVRVLQMAAEKSPDAAASWYEEECARQQLQDTFTSHTGCSSWDNAKENFPNFAWQAEELVGMSKTTSNREVLKLSTEAKALNDDISQSTNILTVNIQIKKCSSILQSDKIEQIIQKYQRQIKHEVMKEIYKNLQINES